MDQLGVRIQDEALSCYCSYAAWSSLTERGLKLHAHHFTSAELNQLLTSALDTIIRMSILSFVPNPDMAVFSLLA